MKIFEHALTAGKASLDRREPITAANFENRAAYHGVKIRQWGDRWPYLSRIVGMPGTADQARWDAYFSLHLKGFPPAYRCFRDGMLPSYNLPEALPEHFDTSYTPALYLA